MKADECRVCKGKGKFIQAVAKSSGGQTTRITRCYKIFDHYKEAVDLLEEVNEIYNRTAKLGKEQAFLGEIYRFLARNNIGINRFGDRGKREETE